jgi:ribonuclease R
MVHRLVRAMLRRGADARGGAIRSDDAQPWSMELARARGKHAALLPVRSHVRESGHGAPNLSQEPGPIAADELSDIAVESSQAERRAADAERELIEWKKMKFMADKIGDDFPAVILSVTKYGFFVELDDMFIEGLVPLGSLVGDYYTFRDTDRTIVGSRTGHVFALGQRVQVLLDRIDRQQRRLQFALLPGTEPKVSAGAPKGSLRVGKSAAKKEKAKDKKVSGKAKARQRKKR